MADYPKNRRSLRKLLIYPEFQIPLIGFNLVVMATGLLAFWVTALRTIDELKPAGAQSGIELEFFHKYLQYQASQFNSLFLVSSLAAIVTSTLFTLFVSHRMAGPMVRLRGHLRLIRDGADPLPQLKFRDNDFLLDLPPLVNETFNALYNRLKGGGSDKKRTRA